MQVPERAAGRQPKSRRFARRGGRLPLIEVDDHVRFVSTYFACAGFTLFLFDLAGRGLNFHHLAGDGHFRFISALFALTLLNSLSLLSHWSKPPEFGIENLKAISQPR
jgi:hypothetical protein